METKNVQGYRVIATPHDVAQFIQYLVFERRCDVNPDDPFDGYQDKDGNDSFSKDECEAYERMMEASFGVCEAAGVDIYEICMRVLGLFHYCDKNDTMRQFYDNWTKGDE